MPPQCPGAGTGYIQQQVLKLTERRVLSQCNNKTHLSPYPFIPLLEEPKPGQGAISGQNIGSLSSQGESLSPWRSAQITPDLPRGRFGIDRHHRCPRILNDSRHLFQDLCRIGAIVQDQTRNPWPCPPGLPAYLRKE